MMTISSRLAMLFLVLVPASATFAASENVPGEPLDRIVAVVNDDVILDSELEQETDQIIQMVRQQGNQQLPPREILRRQVLERMIGVEVQKQFAERNGIRISDDRVNQAMQQIAQNNNTTLSELPQVLAREGVNYREFRESIREDLLVNQVRSRVVESKVSISPREVEDYLNQKQREGANNRYRISQILVAVPGEASPSEIEAARERITELREQIVSGESTFRDIAIRYSDGQRALEGGDLGWRSQQELPTIFVEPVLRLDVGEVSEPVRSGSGWHLVHLDEAKIEEEEPVVATETLARHILIKPNEVMTPAQAEATLHELKRRIENGEDFGELAREFSVDTSASQGGDLGWAPPGRYVPRFQEALDALPEGGISEPFETQFGWHIVQVQDRRDTDFSDVVAENRAYQQIRQRKGEEVYPRWVQQQIEESFIDRRLDN